MKGWVLMPGECFVRYGTVAGQPLHNSYIIRSWFFTPAFSTI